MKKGIFVDLVLLRVNGGVLNDESSTWRADIRAYMPAAINYCVTQGYYTGIKTENDRDLSGLFYGYFPNLPLLNDTTKNNRKYFVLPKGTLALPANQGIRFVTDGCETTYVELQDAAMHTIGQYEGMFPGTGYYRLEKNNIYLYNAPKLINNINLTMIVGVDDLGPDDELPIPAGLEDQAIQLCVEFITGERQLPADRKNDERDLN